MNVDTFLDTNILVYASTPNDPRSPLAQSLLRQGGIISVQVLNEFTNVALWKLKRTWPEITAALAIIRVLFPDPRPITIDTHSAAVRIAANEGFSFYDALIVASAQQAGCATLLSEDLQHGRVIRPGLTVRNPFAGG